MIGDHLTAYTFDYLLHLGMAEIPDTMDKREGSPAYDAAASAAKIVEMGFQQMQKVYQDTFAQYSDGEYLRLRAAENGVDQDEATKAIRKGVFVGNNDEPYPLPIGARFTAMGDKAVNFKVIEETSIGTYKLQCEEVGAIGNEYIGAILPIEVRNGLKIATLSDILIPGEDVESDESLRARYFDEKNSKKFGGNIDQYRQWVTEQNGVAACQVYPVWNGGGTVKISFVDSTYSAASSEHVALIQRLIDPTQDGQGIGLAPIDHIVTVATPTEKLIDVSATVQLANGFTLEQLKPLITAEIELYFTDARQDWGEPISKDSNDYSLTLFRSQVSAAILRVAGVLNVSDLKLNGADLDVELEENPQGQELPRLGVVTLE